jgi:hypothetical protein
MQGCVSMGDRPCRACGLVLLGARAAVTSALPTANSNFLPHCLGPLQDVVSVQRKKNVGFPNSVEVRTSDGRKYFLTSFLSREDAYRC